MPAAYRVVVEESAERELARLPQTARQRVALRIDGFVGEPRPHGVKQLVGRVGLYRVRAGDYRIVYEIDDDARIVTVIAVGHRKDVYRRL